MFIYQDEYILFYLKIERNYSKFDYIIKQLLSD